MIFPYTPYHLDLQENQSWKAELAWHYSNTAAEIDQKDVEEVSFKVVTKEGGTYKISVGRKLVRTELPGVNVNAPDSAKAETTVASIGEGQLFALPSWGLDRNTKRLSRLFDFGKLPAVETWQVQNPEGELPASETTVDEVASAEPTLRVWRWEFKELYGSTPLTGVGFLWTRKKDGFPIAMHVDARNAVLPGGTDQTNLVIDLKVKSDESPPKDAAH